MFFHIDEFVLFLYPRAFLFLVCFISVSTGWCLLILSKEVKQNKESVFNSLLTRQNFGHILFSKTLSTCSVKLFLQVAVYCSYIEDYDSYMLLKANSKIFLLNHYIKCSLSVDLKKVLFMDSLPLVWRGIFLFLPLVDEM